MQIVIDLTKYQYNNIMALKSACLGRAPYKGIIMYAINAIKRGKVLEQEPCEDAISRQAVLDGIEELKKSPWATDKRGNGFEYLITEALDVVADLCVKKELSVNPQSKTGHWIKYDCEYFADGRLTPVTRSIRECSMCHTKISDFRGKMYYCPYCGAKMVEPPESEVSE